MTATGILLVKERARPSRVPSWALQTNSPSPSICKKGPEMSGPFLLGPYTPLYLFTEPVLDGP